MEEKNLTRNIKYVSMLCLIAGIFGLAPTIYYAFMNQRFMAIPVIPFLFIAEGVIYLLAFRADSLEKALKQIDILKFFAIALAAYICYQIVMLIVSALNGERDVNSVYFNLAYYISGVLASLSIFITSITLKSGDVQKFNKVISGMLLLEIMFVVAIAIAALIVSEAIYVVLILLVGFVVIFGVIPKLLSNSVIRGAIIGKIIAGNVGAVIGAMAASNKEKKK